MLVRHVHILFTRPSLSSPAAGLRLEIARDIDKKKSELYFYFSLKKFLTEKAKRACPKQRNFHPRRPEGFSSARISIFFAPVDC